MYIKNPRLTNQQIENICNGIYPTADLFFFQENYTIDELILFYGIENTYIQFLITNKIIIKKEQALEWGLYL